MGGRHHHGMSAHPGVADGMVGHHLARLSEHIAPIGATSTEVAQGRAWCRGIVLRTRSWPSGSVRRYRCRRSLRQFYTSRAADGRPVRARSEQSLGGSLAAVGLVAMAAAAEADWSDARPRWTRSGRPSFWLLGLLLIGLVADQDGVFASVGHHLARTARTGTMLFLGATLIVSITTAVAIRGSVAQGSVPYCWRCCVPAGARRRPGARRARPIPWRCRASFRPALEAGILACFAPIASVSSASIIWCITTSPVAEAKANDPFLIAPATSARATVASSEQVDQAGCLLRLGDAHNSYLLLHGGPLPKGYLVVPDPYHLAGLRRRTTADFNNVRDNVLGSQFGSCGGDVGHLELDTGLGDRNFGGPLCGCHSKQAPLRKGAIVRSVSCLREYE